MVVQMPIQNNMWHKHSSLSCCLKPDPYFVVQAQYQASPMLACKQRTTERLTWWSAAQHQTSPDRCGAVCWPGGRGSGTRVPAGATSAGPSAQRTSALANTEPSGEGKRISRVISPLDFVVFDSDVQGSTLLQD